MKRLTSATLSMYDDFYRIKADENNIKWGGFSKAPNKESFLHWYQRQIDEPSSRRLFLYYVNEKVVGFSSVDYSEGTPEISYGVLIEEASKGYGTEIISKTCELLTDDCVIAFVSECNIGSVRCFEKNGFVKTDVSETRKLELFSEPHTFYKWMKNLK